ncbi:hypothetical protein [Brevundimonas sp.]|uniref:hypothetical protein n=1 Tax=Brevundimonas sp. TaxID=1871086 RepID=UPI001DC0A002|nr:hypothetical protein [Brevundimonas sp.]MBL0947949.1 hypothetical protein [Brevundimonas sp.]
MAEEYEVARFLTVAEAELLVALLGRHGIRAWLPDRDMATMLPHVQMALGGIRVVAYAEQIDAARDIARRARAGEFATPDDNDEWQVEATPGRIGELDEADVQGLVGSRPLIQLGTFLILGSALFAGLLGYCGSFADLRS